MEAGVAARAETETARALAARLFNAQPDEIALTGGNSPGWGSAFAAFATAIPGAPATASWWAGTNGAAISPACG